MNEGKSKRTFFTGVPRARASINHPRHGEKDAKVNSLLRPWKEEGERGEKDFSDLASSANLVTAKAT